MSVVLMGWVCVAVGVVLGLFLGCLFRVDGDAGAE
jgi:hypothetical protein